MNLPYHITYNVLIFKTQLQQIINYGNIFTQSNTIEICTYKH